MSAQWPSSVATDANLYVAVNSLQTTLATALGTGDTSVVLASATGFPVAGGVTIDNEVIFYTGVSGATLTGCTRGADGTTAATHSVGVPVGAAVIAFHHNGLMAEIEAVESYLDTVLGKGTAVTATEFGYVHGVTSAIQTQLNTLSTSDAAKLPLAGGTLTGALTINPATSQLVLGGVSAGKKVTITAPAPATADRVWTIPDITSDATFAALEGTQSFTGTKTFTAAVTINPATNQLVLGGVSAGKKVTITAPAPATADRVWTIPDITADGTFAALQGSQTFTGTKTFNALIGTLAANLAAGGFKLTGLAAGSTAGDSVRYEQLNPGKILQVQVGTSNTAKSTTSSTFQTTNLTVAITPTSNTSTIIVLAFGDLQTSSITTVVQSALFRNSTNISPGNIGAAFLLANAASTSVPAAMATYDSPATTSAITYSVKLASSNNSSSVTFGSNAGQTIIVIEIGQ